MRLARSPAGRHGLFLGFALLFERAPSPLSGGREGGVIGDNSGASKGTGGMDTAGVWARPQALVGADQKRG